MSELYYLKTASRAAILAAIVAGLNGGARRPTIESDGGRLRIGNHCPTETAVETIAFSTAGTTTLALKTHCAAHIALVTASAGAGAYTRKIVAPRLATALDETTLAPIAGDTIEIRLSVAASNYPTVAIYENTDTGTLLLTIAGNGTAFGVTVRLYFTGSAWAVLGAERSALAQIAADLAIAANESTQADLDAHAADTANPHGVTKTQVGLSAVTNDAQLKASDLDTDATLAANSDAKIASQKAVKAYIAAVLAGLAENKGATDCSANPNFPAASNGDFYRVSVAGKIGGASGKVVEVGDVFMAVADNAGGTDGSVGTSWIVLQANITGITVDGLALLRAADVAAQVALLAASLASYAAQAISASGDSTPAIGSGRHTQDVTLSGASSGSGARISLAAAGRVAGDTVRMPVAFAADASRLRIYHATTGGTLLLDQTNDGTARLFFAEFVFNGTAWKLTNGGYFA